jgi:hypothetical protein
MFIRLQFRRLADASAVPAPFSRLSSSYLVIGIEGAGTIMYRDIQNANDNIKGFHLLSQPDRARAMACLSPEPVAELWELHAQLCEDNSAARRRSGDAGTNKIAGKVIKLNLPRRSGKNKS